MAPRIVMTLLVRNEEDVIAENILFHYHQGVSEFIVMDNLSSDRTPEILRDLSRQISITVLLQEEDTYDQSRWVTSMAQQAFEEHKADWVINNDADEFWLFPSFDAVEYLSSVKPSISGLLVQRYNAVLEEGLTICGMASHPSSTFLFERRSVNALGRPLPPKCLHRGLADVIVAQGNHSITGHPGSLVDDSSLSILHFPYRSLAHYRAKIRLGGDAYSRNTRLPTAFGDAWRVQRELLETDDLGIFWNSIHYSPQFLQQEISSGDVFENRALVNVLKPLMKRHQRRLFRRSLRKFRRESADEVSKSVSSLQVSARESRSGEKSLSQANFSSMVRGPEQYLRSIQSLRSCKLRQMTGGFSRLRDLFSLYPRGQSAVRFLNSLLNLVHPYEASSLRSDCRGRVVVLHLSCESYVDKAIASRHSFAGVDVSHVVVVGSSETVSEPNRIGFKYCDGVLQLPVGDHYEFLATKVFYALMILRLVGNCQYVIKVDDDIYLEDAGKFESFLGQVHAKGINYCGQRIELLHRDQPHGWHVGKCRDTRLSDRGYQYPMPSSYASGGFGYLLGGEGLDACMSMFLGMRSFFAQSSVQLEDVFVGLALQSRGIPISDLESLGYSRIVGSDQVRKAALPGLMRRL